MTDNEKRAHDLAIAAIPYAMDAAKQMVKEGTIDGFPFYKVYLQIYEDLLKAFQRDFPE